MPKSNKIFKVLFENRKSFAALSDGGCAIGHDHHGRSDRARSDFAIAIIRNAEQREMHLVRALCEKLKVEYNIDVCLDHGWCYIYAAGCYFLCVSIVVVWCWFRCFVSGVRLTNCKRAISYYIRRFISTLLVVWLLLLLLLWYACSVASLVDGGGIRGRDDDVDDAKCM